MQILWNVNVDLLHDRHRLEWSRTVRERLEHQAFEQFAMSNVFAEQEWRGAPQNFIPTLFSKPHFEQRMAITSVGERPSIATARANS